MANTLKIKRSAVEGKIPLTTDLQLGELAVNTYDGKLFLKRNDGINDYIVEVGGNVGFDVKNQTGSTITKGTVVRFAGTLGASGKLLVTPFLADGTYPSDYVVGVVENDIVDGEDGFAIDHGKIYNLNTSAFSQGDILYASSTVAGGLTATQPSAPNNKVTIAAVVHSSSTAGILEVRVTLGSQLTKDELVELNSLANNDILVYDSTDERFENKQLKTINNESLIGSGNISISGGGISFSTKTANYTASAGEGVLANTTSGSFTITLPASPSSGDQVIIADSNDFSINNLTVARNGSTIEGLSEDLILDIQGISVQFIYNGSTWQIYSQVGGNGGTEVTLNGAQTLTNKTLTDPAIIGTILEDVYTISDGAAFEIDPSNGSIQLITLGASRTPKATNFAAGESITLMVDDGTAYTLTWTDATWGGSGVVWTTDGGVAPTLNTSGYTSIVLWKVGSQVYGARVGDS